jgi:hypothetical protein
MDYLIAFGCGALGWGLAYVVYYFCVRRERRKYLRDAFLRSLER